MNKVHTIHTVPEICLRIGELIICQHIGVTPKTERVASFVKWNIKIFREAPFQQVWKLGTVGGVTGGAFTVSDRLMHRFPSK